ncbi:MAG: Tfp pilus assembly protein PilF [Oceanicoccus sp.]|jgi:Tfp pilus assembly protein PilF
MKFINRRLLCILLLVLLSACQFVPELPSANQTAVESEQQADVIAATEPSTPQRLPNPYLQQRPNVSEETRRTFAQAKRLMEEKNWEAAEIELQLLIVSQPQLSGPYLQLALLYKNTGRADLAKYNFEQSIKANGNNVYAYNHYALFLREQGGFDSAEEVYQQALMVWPDYASAHLNLGILYDLYRGQLQQALNQYQIYQRLQDQPDRKVTGWIIDIERRLKRAQAQE